MLKYFVVITGLAGIVGTSIAVLSGPILYITLFLSFLFSLLTFITWSQSERADHLKVLIIPLLLNHLKRVDSEEVSFFAQMAKSLRIQNQFAELLICVLDLKPDYTERYWIYIALGLIGGKVSKRAVKGGLLDENKFARLGAESAWQILTGK